MGSITEVAKIDKRTGKSTKKFRAYVRRMIAGKSVGSSKVCATRSEAKEWLRNNEADFALIANAKERGKTFAKVADLFAKAPPARGTKYWEPAHVDFWIVELGNMGIGEISRGDINAAIAKLQTAKAQRHTPVGLVETDKTLSAGTINRYLASLSSVFNFAVDREIIDLHPMKAGRVRKLKEGNGRKRILNDDEVLRLLKAAEESRWPMMPLFLRMLLTTAARKSEVLNLKWQDVNLAESVAILHETKNGRARALPLVADVKAALIEANKVRPIKSDHVFFDPKHPERPKNVDVIWKCVRQRAGLWQDRADRLDQVVLHTTRHSAVTKMLKGGANLTQAAVVSGHQTLAMLKRYEHLAAQDAVELAQRLLGGNDSKTA